MSDTHSQPASPKGRKRRALMWSVLVLLALFGTLSLAIGIWAYRLDREISERFAQKRFAPPVEFYSAPELIRVGFALKPEDLIQIFNRRGYRAREFGQPLLPLDYSVWPGEGCQELLPRDSLQSTLAGEALPKPGITTCVAFRHQPAATSSSSMGTIIDSSPGEGAGDIVRESEPVQIVRFGKTDSGEFEVLGTYAGANPRAVDAAVLTPELFAQYYGDRPTLRTEVNLGQVPPSCKDALLSIEDPGFLEHAGISFTALIRAVIANLRRGRFAQGGSTITQQLVKNYFLTEEKTLKRKFTEITMAFLVERHASKEDILETYLNLIYMGQNGPFEVRGFAAASQYYFAKPIDSLALHDCALLAAVLNSPGMFNPFTKPEAALKRRTRVLDKMLETGRIDSQTYERATAEPLPKSPARAMTEPAPYFVKSARRELERLGLDLSAGLRVYTTLDLRAQEAAQTAVREGLEKIESSAPQVKKMKEKGKHLEALLISADPSSGFITAIVGGRSYSATQYNRAMDSRRQVGSVMKPFVFLTALESGTRDGEPYSPESELEDKTYTIKYEGQSWSPRNYDGKYRGTVPLWFSLVESLNASTAQLGQEVGIKNVIDLSRRAGITSKLENLPSLALGAFELSPLEVLQSYTTLSRLGSRVPLSTLYRVEDLTGRELHSFRPAADVVVNTEATAMLVGILKNAIDQGTGRGARALGLIGPAAGKTGTTNDKKDSWFAGFTPFQSAVVWVGYDDNTPHGLTGASGAVPIWTRFMIQSQKLSKRAVIETDFPWPDTVQIKTLQEEDLRKYEGIGDLVKPPVPLIELKEEKPSSSFF
jgi:penicillin-binding protein 1B